MRRCLIYLGTHQPQWLARYDVPMFISRRRLTGKKLPRARGRWALDSGGFSELQLHGRWVTTPEQYVEEVRRFIREIGKLDWAAIQDWMCEPQVINGLVKKRNPSAKRPPAIDYALWKAWALGVAASGHVGVASTLAAAEGLEAEGHEVEVVFHGTGLSVEEHQRRTIESYRTLRGLAPEVNWTPVIQGDFLTGTASHLSHIEQYRASGFDLRQCHTVGVGSVCRLRETSAAERFFNTIHDAGIRAHGFGVKGDALLRVAHLLQSSDSMAWSYAARRQPPLPGCTGHINCANCATYAMRWLDMIQAGLHGGERGHGQLSLFPELTRRAA